MSRVAFKYLIFGFIFLCLGINVLYHQGGTQGQQAYEYYGYIPDYFNYTQVLDEPLSAQGPINGTAYIDVIGFEDDTNVAIYDINSPNNPNILVQTVLNKMSLYTYRLPRNYYFKVASNKPVAVSISGGNNYYGQGIEEGMISVFYPSIDGGFAGKEFIFMAYPNGKRHEWPPPRAVVHAIEDAHLTVYDDKGRVLGEWDLPGNSSRKDIVLTPRMVFRVVSTGRIMLANWVGDSYVALPNAFGGYSGTRFFTREEGAGGGRWDEVILVITAQSNPAKVSILDPRGDKFGEKSISARELWKTLEGEVNFRGKNTMLMSTSNVMAFVGSVNKTGEAAGGEIHSMRDGITFFGIRPNEPTTFYVISKGIIFSPEANARITIGALTVEVEKGGYANLPSGLVTVTSNTTLIVETVASANPWNGQTSFGAYLITTKTVNMVYPPAKVSESGLPLVQVAAVAGVAAVVAVILVLKKPWKRP